MTENVCSFFMGANSANGFVSLFDRIDVPRIYTVKSGPGCGKSTLIRKICAALCPDGDGLELIFCSSDPASLDGAILRKQGVAVIDGTAPHVSEPAFPGAGGDYITLSPFTDAAALAGRRAELERLKEEASARYARAYQLISASVLTDRRIRSSVSACTAADRVLRRVKGLIARELPDKKNCPLGRLTPRFLDGVTPEGELCLFNTVPALAERVFNIVSDWDLSGIVLEPLRDAALSRGYNVYACLDPREPERLRHLIVPELSLAFVSSSAKKPYTLPCKKKILLDSYIDRTLLRPIRGQMRLLARISAELMRDAVSEIREAHRLHDEIEAVYRPYIDFAALDARTAEVIAEIKRAL